jgi:MYXO-CTERM domain-containing protein
VSAEGKPAPLRVRPSGRRSGGGCCAAQSTPGSPLAMSLAVLGLLRFRRRR